MKSMFKILVLGIVVNNFINAVNLKFHQQGDYNFINLNGISNVNPSIPTSTKLDESKLYTFDMANLFSFDVNIAGYTQYSTLVTYDPQSEPLYYTVNKYAFGQFGVILFKSPVCDSGIVSLITINAGELFINPYMLLASDDIPYSITVDVDNEKYSITTQSTPQGQYSESKHLVACLNQNSNIDVYLKQL